MVRQVAWILIIPQLSLMGLIVLACYLSGAANPFVNGALIYLAVSYMLRTGFAKDHNRGMRLIKQHNYLGATPFFEASYKYFMSHPLIDKHRYLTLLSSPQMCYEEMAPLNNIAFSYKRTLESFPNNGLAQAGLKRLESAGQQI